MVVGKRRVVAILAGCITATLLCGSGARAADNTPAPAASGADTAARQLLAHRLVDDAYARTRDIALSTERVSQEAMILLQAAAQLDPSNLHTLKLLAEAAKNGDGSAAVRKETLRKILALDPGDMVAVVSYLDVLASENQVLENRAKVYRAALASTQFDPQVRSIMAVRLAVLSSERGETDVARKYLHRALELNSVNVEALRQAVPLAGRAPADRLKALIALLSVDPYEPEAWREAAGILGSSGLHDRAAEALVASMEQMTLSGEKLTGELYLELALEYGAAGHGAEAYPILSSLAKLPDAPMSAMMAAQLLAPEYSAPVRTPASANTAPAGGNERASGQDGEPAAGGGPAPAMKLPDAIFKHLSAAIAADPKSSAALEEGVWVELAAVPSVAPQTADWLKSYAAGVKPEDPTLLRLRGWQLLRAGKFEDARAALAKVAAADPLAQLGLARVLIAEKKDGEAGRQLQELWASHPTGLSAFQVAQTAKAAHISLADTAFSREMLAVWGALPATAAKTQRQPRDLELVSVNLPPQLFALGDPVLLNVRLTNTTNRPLPVGPDGVIKTTIGLTARTQGMNGKILGMYAVEDLQRLYRIEPGASIEATVRVDSALLGDLFMMNPATDFTVGLGVITAPRGSAQAPQPGLGGQQITLPDFERTGIPLEAGALTKRFADSATLPLDKQMLRGQLAATIAGGIPQEFKGDPQDERDAAFRQAELTLRGSLINLLAGYLKSPSPILRAWLLQSLPITPLNDAIRTATDALATDPDPLVRMMWALRESMTARNPALSDAAVADLKKVQGQEKDAAVKQWMTIMLQDARTAQQAAAKAAASQTAPQQ